MGAALVARLDAVVAIGPTTAAALTAEGIRHVVSPRADFAEAARCLEALRKT
ncbi:MAG: hypothetical protein ABI665_25175 [Vicinamibacterales bacterium]